MSKHCYSELYKAKNLGSSSGFCHWWMQRITSILLIPISLWLMLQFKIDGADLKKFLSHMSNFSALIIFIICAFYHARIGMQVIVEDYIHSFKMKLSLLILLDTFVCVTIVTTIVALCKI